MTRAPRKWKRRLWQAMVLLAFALISAGVCQFSAEPPGDRAIHVESFRYGKDPSVIRCNRGDRLRLTFSTRDTGHSFFLEEFDLDAKISPGDPDVALFRPSDPEAPPRLMREVVFKAEHPAWLRWLVSKSAYRCHVWCGPMHAFEQGNLVIEPNTLLYAGWGLLLGITCVGWISLRGTLRQKEAATVPVLPTDGRDLFKRWPWLRRLTKWRGFQFTWIAVTMALLYLVILTALFGTQMPGRNLGIMLTWVLWLFLLTAVLTPLGGRLWCLACPLPALGEMAQRGAITGVRTGSTAGTNNRFFGLNLRWPGRLENDWPRLLVFLTLGTFSTILVALPRVSGWLILGLVVLAFGMGLVWQGRSFCRYICPVGAFLALYARLGKLALRTADPNVCNRCEVRSCQNGSEQGWACPYGLCVAEINENNDCGLCTECVKTCPYDNVTLRWRPLACETKIRSGSEAWLAMVMLALATAYCVVHLGPWPAVRDYVNILDKGNWHLFGRYVAVLWTAALVGLPALMLGLAVLGRRLATTRQSAWALMTASTGALVPIGLAVWIAFVAQMLAVNVSFVRQSLSDPFGWGWDFFGTANTPWHQLYPRAIPWFQVGCIALGLGYSLRSAWRIWLELIGRPRAALRGMIPIALFLVVLSGWFVRFFAD